MSSERRLLFEEHYILKNIKSYILQYLLLWVAALGLAVGLTYIAPYDPDASVTKAFAVSTTTLSVTTITFALPTCMRTIFAAYDNYHSTTIRTLLMTRFPITLLSLSSFTSLIVSMLVVSGIIGTYVLLPGWSVLAVVLFWALVCVFYLFCAIEKLVHFVVKAPAAVIDKLEFNIYEARSLQSEEEYDEFRQNLASMSDVAATIVRNSTGKDTTIIKYLDQLRQIHRVYAQKAITDLKDDVRHRHNKACYACGKELTKLYREAANNNNGDATRAILKSYCLIVQDSIEMGCSRNYLTELLSQVRRFQSYSLTARAPEIVEQASIHWFFTMLMTLQDMETTHSELVRYAKHCIVREMLITLRKATQHKNEDVLTSFVRIASNSDLDVSTYKVNDEWMAVLDRVILLYLNWLIKAKPEGVRDCIDLLRRHSYTHTDTLRPLFCTTVDRFKRMLALERFNDDMGRRSIDFSKQEAGTAALMDMPLNIDASRFLCYLVEMTYVNATDEELFAQVPELERVCDSAAIPTTDDTDFSEMVKLASRACPHPEDLSIRYLYA